jgi:hypothetical protein
MVEDAALKRKKGIFSNKTGSFEVKDLCSRLRGKMSKKTKMKGRETAMGLDMRAKMKRKMAAR